MCELFAMSTAAPTSVSYSLEEFSRYGSSVRNNRDGWGIALERDRDAFLIKEAQPASDSAWVKFMADNPIKTNMAIAHVRYATRGQHTMENTHPFRRVLAGRTHLFAHNGTLKDIESNVDGRSLPHMPIGNTDSELAFCTLLSRLEALHTDTPSPELQSRFDMFHEFCSDMKKLGSSNFLFWDGEFLFVHAHERIHEHGKGNDIPEAPGLSIKRYWEHENDHAVACPGLEIGIIDSQTVLLASVPLDDNGWEPLEEGAVLALRNGRIMMER